MDNIPRCPLCGCFVVNGKCENRECVNHWEPNITLTTKIRRKTNNEKDRQTTTDQRS